MKTFLAVIAILGGLAVASLAAEQTKAAPTEITVKGEVLDMACYLDHGAQGAKHAECATMCIKSGLPVGLKAEDGTVYLLIGDHKPLNAQLADYAAKTVTVRGKLVERDGFKMIANAELRM